MDVPGCTRGDRRSPDRARDADAAAARYARAFGAEEESRIPLPGGKVLSVVLRFGRSHVHVAGEFPEFSVVSPLTIGVCRARARMIERRPEGALTPSEGVRRG
jgi:hypothetical protein